MFDVPILSELFENLPLGVVVLDQAGKVVVYNRAEERLAGRKKDAVMGREFFVEVAPCLNVRELGGEFVAKIGKAPLHVNLEVSFPFPFLDQPRDVRVKLSSFEAEGRSYGFLLVEDISVARSIDRMKETLQSLLIHDLKNPLAVVLANLGFVQDHPTLSGDVDVAEAISDSITASRRLQSMLLNLLDISRLETSTMPIKRAAFELRPLLERIADLGRGVARPMGGTIRVDAPDEPIWLTADAEMIRRALENLVDNAFRHARNVTLRAQTIGPQLHLSVVDDGPGIPLELRERIFDKFTQVAVTDTSKTASNRGLGLTFVKLAAEAHGGRIEVSCPPAGGSCFDLVLPMVTGAPRRAVAEPAVVRAIIAGAFTSGA